MDYSTTVNTTGNEAELAAAAGAATGFVLLFAALVYVLTSLGLMQFFKKAGRPGWAAWVPFYNYYVMTEIAKVPMYWFWALLAGVVLSWVPVVGFVLTLVPSIYITHKFLQQYGKDTGHTVLAVLFPFVYFPVAGYSKSLTYSGGASDAASTAATQAS